MEDEEDMTFMVELSANFPLADHMKVASVPERADVCVLGYIPREKVVSIYR